MSDAHWNVRFARTAEKDLGRLDPQVRKRVIVAIRQLAQDPGLGPLRKLAGRPLYLPGARVLDQPEVLQAPEQLGDLALVLDPEGGPMGSSPSASPRPGPTMTVMTTKERLHRLVDDLPESSADEAEDALRLVVERHKDDAQSLALGHAIAKGYERVPPTPEEDGWALANAREAIREESW